MKILSRKWDRKLCRLCKQHPAKFRYAGRVRCDADHDICFRCFHGLRDSCLARGIANLVPASMIRFEETSAFFRQALEQRMPKRYYEPSPTSFADFSSRESSRKAATHAGMRGMEAPAEQELYLPRADSEKTRKWGLPGLFAHVGAARSI
jgi:hypothetical protein